jgi:glycosyltransferase involved in cell wall biosynthesis
VAWLPADPVFRVDRRVPEGSGMTDQGLLHAQKFDRSVSLLAWGLNEELLLEGFLDKAFAMLEAAVTDYEIVFVNDGSTDRTAEILAAYQASEPRLKVINNPENVNVGISCRRAVNAASKEYLFWQTVDWSYDLTELGIYLELLNHFDVVQGIRPVPERLLSYIPLLRSIYRVQRRSDSIVKAAISLTNYYVLRILFGVHFHDFQNVTFYPTRLAQSLSLQATTPFVNPELLIKAYYSGASIIEVPINFIPRTEGEAKGTRLPILVRTIRDILKNWLSWGWRLRLSHRKSGRGSISRVARPLLLPESVVRTVIPLFKKFQ